MIFFSKFYTNQRGFSSLVQFLDCTYIRASYFSQKSTLRLILEPAYSRVYIVLQLMILQFMNVTFKITLSMQSQLFTQTLTTTALVNKT